MAGSGTGSDTFPAWIFDPGEELMGMKGAEMVRDMVVAMSRQTIVVICAIRCAMSSHNANQLINVGYPQSTKLLCSSIKVSSVGLKSLVNEFETASIKDMTKVENRYLDLNSDMQLRIGWWRVHRSETSTGA